MGSRRTAITERTEDDDDDDDAVGDEDDGDDAVAVTAGLRDDDESASAPGTATPLGSISALSSPWMGALGHSQRHEQHPQQQLHRQHRGAVTMPGALNSAGSSPYLGGAMGGAGLIAASLQMPALALSRGRPSVSQRMTRSLGLTAATSSGSPAIELPALSVVASLRGGAAARAAGIFAHSPYGSGATGAAATGVGAADGRNFDEILHGGAAFDVDDDDALLAELNDDIKSAVVTTDGHDDGPDAAPGDQAPAAPSMQSVSAALRSKLRGLSFDESAYWASVEATAAERGGDDAGTGIDGDAASGMSNAAGTAPDVALTVALPPSDAPRAPQQSQQASAHRRAPSGLPMTGVSRKKRRRGPSASTVSSAGSSSRAASRDTTATSAAIEPRPRKPSADGGAHRRVVRARGRAAADASRRVAGVDVEVPSSYGASTADDTGRLAALLHDQPTPSASPLSQPLFNFKLPPDHSQLPAAAATTGPPPANVFETLMTRVADTLAAKAAASTSAVGAVAATARDEALAEPTPLVGHAVHASPLRQGIQRVTAATPPAAARIALASAPRNAASPTATMDRSVAPAPPRRGADAYSSDGDDADIDVLPAPPRRVHTGKSSRRAVPPQKKGRQ